MIGWIQLREETSHRDLRRLAHSDLVPGRAPQCELKEQIAEKTAALCVAAGNKLSFAQQALESSESR